MLINKGTASLGQAIVRTLVVSACTHTNPPDQKRPRRSLPAHRSPWSTGTSPQAIRWSLHGPNA